MMEPAPGLPPAGAADATVLVRRLGLWEPLALPETRALNLLVGERVRQFGPRDDLVREGESPRFVHLVLAGWVARYRMLEDGRRQMVAILLPGDICDPHNVMLEETDHSLSALSAAVVAQIAPASLVALLEDYPRLARALWVHWHTLGAMQREWTVNNGLRSAHERIGSLFCELFLRLRAVGLTRGCECDFPITQGELAEATGLTSVHVNRTLQDMRASGLIRLRNRVLEIPDLARLASASLYSPAYLRLGGHGRLDCDPGEALRAPMLLGKRSAR